MFKLAKLILCSLFSFNTLHLLSRSGCCCSCIHFGIFVQIPGHKVLCCSAIIYSFSFLSMFTTGPSESFKGSNHSLGRYSFHKCVFLTNNSNRLSTQGQRQLHCKRKKKRVCIIYSKLPAAVVFCLQFITILKNRYIVKMLTIICL